MTTPSYLAAIGSVRAWETKLLTEAEQEKMLGARTFEEAFQMLHDLSFAEFLGEAKSAEDFDMILNSGLYETKAAMTQLMPDASVLEVLWLLYDLHNAKVLLKGKLMRDNADAFEDMLLSYASRSPQRMKDLVNGEMAREEDKWIQKAFTEAIQNYAETQDPLSAEHVLDTAFLGHIRGEADVSGNTFVQKFVRSVIDAHNILSAFRSILRKHEDFLYIEGGNLSKNSLKTGSLEELVEHLPLSWKEIVQEGKDEFEQTGNFMSLENKLAEAIMKTLSDAKFVIDGPEPLIAFFWRKQNDSKIIRTILVGKRAGLPEETIRNSLPKIL